MWEQLGSHYIQTDGPPGKWLKAKCRHCNWQQSANSSRMRKHYFEAHAPASLSQSSASSQSSHSGASTFSSLPMVPDREGRQYTQQTLQSWADCAFTADRQRSAEMCLALLQVRSSLAYKVLENPCMAAFCRSLRADFKLPSRRTLQRRVHDLFLETCEDVNAVLRNRTVCISITQRWAFDIGTIIQKKLVFCQLSS